MNTQPDIPHRRAYRIFNAVFWLAVWVAVVIWTEAWPQTWVIALEGTVPLALGGYIHLILRPGGTASD